MRPRLALIAVPAGLILLAGAVYFWDYGTLNPFEASSVVYYQGCDFHPTKTIESLDSATNFEHNAIAYANMPVRRVSTLLNGMAVYALPLGPGMQPCSAAPMDIYIEIYSGHLRLYRRCCGP
jgi:hypothetical protein